MNGRPNGLGNETLSTIDEVQMKRNWVIFVLVGFLLFLGILLLIGRDTEDEKIVVNEKPRTIGIILKIAVILILCTVITYLLVTLIPNLAQYWQMIAVFLGMITAVSAILGFYGHYRESTP